MICWCGAVERFLTTGSSEISTEPHEDPVEKESKRIGIRGAIRVSVISDEELIAGKMATAKREDKNTQPFSPVLPPPNNVICIKLCGHNLKIVITFDPSLGVSGIIWDAGVVLCKYFEKENIRFSGKKVIELGSGTGLVGILAALLGGEVTLTDQAHALPQIEVNVAANIPPSNVRRSTVSALSWGQDQNSFPADYDVILGSELVYHPSSYIPLLQTLLHLSQKETVIYLCSAMNPYTMSSSFYHDMLPPYFNCQLVYRDEIKNCNVYKVTKI